MEGIEKVIGWFGAIALLGGILVGGYLFFSIDKESFDRAKEIAESLSTNSLAQAEYQAVASLYYAQLTFALSILFGGSVVGLFFLGFAKLITTVLDQEHVLNEKLGNITRAIQETEKHRDVS
ncbi:hypothetical protein AB685_14975 [Bacillus sp. LL01]|uniref:hypothetical protein n=1 Tax=Bacillus sp. LL01 TaxID=1665556 RepID=UPI00064CDCD4|nr:hypothetical protein [Bacillus sp. LL01]KMJ58103.1 hypothetical protein AB685_14975 [Bacillus sp. LL01]